MKSILALSAVLSVALATPLVDYSTNTGRIFESSPAGKQSIGGLSIPSTFAPSLNTKAAPVNYGNLNMGTGMMPSQIVHYGAEDHPDHGQISPTLISTTAKEADYQFAEADKTGRLINAHVDVGGMKYSDFNKQQDQTIDDIDEDSDEDDLSKWGWGWGWGWRRPWGRRHWRWHRYRRGPYWY
ncbi:hypothetical protein BGX27_008387 [Mortierella sp. AM989]|nr:hypothetical protein BGX27_008387 [Mortierella sp. AM989]